jgi:hypothetical protein
MKNIERLKLYVKEYIKPGQPTLAIILLSIIGDIEKEVINKVSNSVENQDMLEIMDKTGKRIYEKATAEQLKKTLNRIDFLLYNKDFNDADRVCISKTAILELDLFGESH